MRLKSVLACLIIVAAFPLLASQSGNRFVNSVPLASVAFAGHSLIGSYYCECGSEGCRCDEGETPPGGNHSTNSITKKTDGSFDQGATPVSESGLDIGASAMMMALAVLVWARFLRT